jgi:urate oxidase
MPIHLAGNNYGKSRVRVVKVMRGAERHELAELTVNVQFQGDFGRVHTEGDNSPVLPTDTMKNTVHALAKAWNGGQIEDFGLELAAHFLDGNPPVSGVRIGIARSQWIRLGDFSFVRGSEEEAVTEVAADRAGSRVESGIDNLVILKTTGSAFEGYKKDRYTTLQETSDRILATALTARWIYSGAKVPFNSCREKTRTALIRTFAGRESPSAQHTAYAMGEAALNAVPEIESIRLSLPNKHCLLVDMAPFGLDNGNEIFVPTDEPHGLIEVAMRRG